MTSFYTVSREGIRGVLKLVMGRNDNTPPAPSQEGNRLQPVAINRFKSDNNKHYINEKK